MKEKTRTLYDGGLLFSLLLIKCIVLPIDWHETVFEVSMSGDWHCDEHLFLSPFFDCLTHFKIVFLISRFSGGFNWNFFLEFRFYGNNISSFYIHFNSEHMLLTRPLHYVDVYWRINGIPNHMFSHCSHAANRLPTYEILEILYTLLAHPVYCWEFDCS